MPAEHPGERGRMDSAPADGQPLRVEDGRNAREGQPAPAHVPHAAKDRPFSFLAHGLTRLLERDTWVGGRS